jgi:myxalamid-type polyketide synthase MxaB
VNFIPGAAYLVTGAYGGLGFRTVQWMADSGATRIVMAGRREPSPQIRRQIEALRDRGIEIYDLLANISKRSDAKKIFNCVAEARLVLRGIIHAAGTIDDGTLLQQTPQHFERVFASKVCGGWLLHELSQNSPLDFFVLFGSAASVLGSAGQSNYAAANGFLDGLSYHRQQAGLPSTTIAWGAWSEIGMATRVKDTGRAARMGVSALSPDKGIELLEQAIASNFASVAALPIDWSVYLAPGHAQHGWPFFESLSVVEERIHPSPERSTTLKTLLGRSSAEQKPNVIREHMRTRIADVLRLDPSFVLRNDQPLAELGLDSLMALELKNELQASLGETLPPNFFFEYSTLDMAATYLNARLVVTRSGRAESNSSEYEELAI